MNPNPIERASEIACNLVMTTLSLVLIGGYVCLFHVFRADREEVRAASMQHHLVVPHDETLSYRDGE